MVTIYSIVVLIFGVLLFLFICWCWLLNFKPVVALWLFVGDLFSHDWSSFNGFGFWLFCGLGGSGKTLSMVEYLDRVSSRYPDLKVFTNFRCDVAHAQIESWQDILDCENYSLVPVDVFEFDRLAPCNRYSRGLSYYKKIHHGIIFGFDEIHLTFASQRWESAPDNMLEYISQQRKLHKQIVASAQVFSRVDKKLREQTNFVIECKSVFWGRWVFNKYFNTTEYISNDEKMDSGNRKRKRSKRYSFVGTNRIRDLYDTYQVMVDLRSGKSDLSVSIGRVGEVLSRALS